MGDQAFTGSLRAGLARLLWLRGGDLDRFLRGGVLDRLLVLRGLLRLRLRSLFRAFLSRLRDLSRRLRLRLLRLGDLDLLLWFRLEPTVLVPSLFTTRVSF
jgi:hypothetical protein